MVLSYRASRGPYSLGPTREIYSVLPPIDAW